MCYSNNRPDQKFSSRQFPSHGRGCLISIKHQTIDATVYATFPDAKLRKIFSNCKLFRDFDSLYLSDKLIDKLIGGGDNGLMGKNME